MMECRDIRKNLSAYLEGMVSREERELIDQHLASCRGCSSALHELNRTGEMLKNLKEVEPPPGMKEKIMARVREEAEPKKGFIQKLFYPLHIKLPLEAFATVLVAVLAVYVFKAVEPRMKGLQVSSPREPSVARQEAPYPAKAPAAEPQAPREKEAARKPPAKAEGKDLAIAPPSPPAAAGVGQMREDKMALAEGAARERKELKKAQPMAPSLRMAAKTKAEAISFLVRVKDVGMAGGELESLLHRLNALNAQRESRGNNEVFTAELKADKIKELDEKLRLLGVVQEREASVASREKDATLRIEIILAR
jgi:hypothetical protein